MTAKSHGALPDFCFNRATDISAKWLTSRGLRGVLLDIDNTITRWERVEVSDADMAWLQSLQDAGLKIMLLSNGLAHKKSSVTRQTGLAQVSGQMVKPFPAAFRQGLADMGIAAAEAVMIGDSVMTDICGANRSGIWTILVEPMSSVDFFGTKVYRFLELVLNFRRPLHPENDFRKQGLPQEPGN